MNEKHYIFSLASIFVTAFLFVGLFNYVADPFSIFQSPRIKQFNEKKVGFTRHLRLSKAELVASKQPDAIILGTSRAGYGLSPEHPGLAGNNAFNLSMADMTLKEMLSYMKHANAIQPLNKVVLAVDYRLLFNITPNPTFNESRLATDGVNVKYVLSRMHDWYTSLFTYDAFLTTLRMIRYQSWVNQNLLENGFWQREVADSQQYNAFRVYTENTIERLRGYRSGTIENADFQNEPLRYFREIVQYCHLNHIQLFIIISPSHGWHWETLNRLDAIPAFNAFIRQLVLINEEESNTRFSNNQPFPFWDFSGYNNYSMERVPVNPDDGKRVEWFWESVHYKKELGDIMLDQVLGNDLESNDQFFGVQLNSNNLFERENEFEQKSIIYEVEHPDEIGIIQALIDRVEQ